MDAWPPAQIFYLAPNAYALVKECGWLLGPIRVMGYFRWVAEGVFLSNQVLQALVLMPVERLLPTLRCLKLIQPTVDMSQIRMGIDLPARVYVILVSVRLAIAISVLNACA